MSLDLLPENEAHLIYAPNKPDGEQIKVCKSDYNPDYCASNPLFLAKEKEMRLLFITSISISLHNLRESKWFSVISKQ